MIEETPRESTRHTEVSPANESAASDKFSRAEGKVTRKTLKRDLRERFVEQQYQGRGSGDIVFVDAIFTDTDTGCLSAEEEKVKDITAKYITSLGQSSVPDLNSTDPDTKSGATGGSVSSATTLLTGGGSSNLCHSLPSTTNSATPTNSSIGGYDGGFTLGWEGTWNMVLFEKLIAKLDVAKEQAQLSCGHGHVKVDLDGTEIIVDPCGRKVGTNIWHYKFHAFGVTFLLHRNPGNSQQVRATYGAEALILNTLPALHGHVCQFLSRLGLTVIKETITRVDMQVTVDIPLMDLLTLIFKQHAVQKPRRAALYLKSGIPETYVTGSIDDVQICLYNKRAEMRRMVLEKRELVIAHSLGWEWWRSKRPITRVEFRLGREALRCLGVNSVEDLLKREQGITDLISHDWFRLLERVKVPGRGRRAKMHPLWQRVRALFFEYFPGSGIRDVTYRKPEPISFNPDLLLRQVVGCVAKVIAFQGGKQASSADIAQHVARFGEQAKEEILRKANLHVEDMEITKGILLGVVNNVSGSPNSASSVSEDDDDW